jgi:hypothetical protein
MPCTLPVPYVTEKGVCSTFSVVESFVPSTLCSPQALVVQSVPMTHVFDAAESNSMKYSFLPEPNLKEQKYE